MYDISVYLGIRFANVFEDKKNKRLKKRGRGNCARLFTLDRVEDVADQGQQEDERELHCHLRGGKGTKENWFGLLAVPHTRHTNTRTGALGSVGTWKGVGGALNLYA